MSGLELRVEHHAVLFALMAKHAMEHCGDKAKQVLIDSVTKYGEERGARMAQRAIKNGDPLDLVSNQAYGEWRARPEEMEGGVLCYTPTYHTYAAKCPWCDAWNKHGLLDYGKFYCYTIDEAVFRGFNPQFTMKTLTNLSFGADKCEFDWHQPMSQEEADRLAAKKEHLGTSCLRDFAYHTAHLLQTVGGYLEEHLGQQGAQAVEEAKADFVKLFGQEALDTVEAQTV